MQVKQIYGLVNEATKEVLGEEALVNEDLSNLVDVGEAIFNANKVDNYVKALVNRIGKTIFVTRAYSGSAPSVLMDKWEFGSVLQKVSADLPEASENESWELEDGASYDQDIFYKPSVEVKFYNSKTTFEVDMSFTELQLKQSFTSQEEMNSFLSMLFNEVDKSMTVKVDALVMRTINNFIAETVYAEYQGAGIGTKSGIRAVNLLKLYNTDNGTSLTADQAIRNKDFLRYSALKLKLYAGRLKKMSRLFNIGGKARFTPKDMLHIVLLDEFESGASIYLQSDTFNKELVQLPTAETVAYWQGSGTDYAFSNTGKIDVKTSGNHTQVVTGIIGVMFDRDALGVTCLDKRVTTHYNAKAEFYNNFYKHDAGYFNDFNENFVVFFVA